MNSDELRKRLVIATTRALTEMGYQLTYTFTLFKPGVEITFTRTSNPGGEPLVLRGDNPTQVMRDLALSVLSPTE